MIVSFGDRRTEALFHHRTGEKGRPFPPEIISAALRKLDSLNAATSLNDLRCPPGNRLEGLQGSWRGFHSLRINRQWRLVFRWEGGNAHEVQILDYH